MIERFLARNEGKTLEFKENCRPLHAIVRTVVAFANTAGGSIVIGVKDKTRDVVGIPEPLAEEERLANAFADSVSPLLIPDIQIHAWRNRQLIVVVVPHSVGPYYVRSEGPNSGVYVRLGSTNRSAGPELIAEIRRLARNTFLMSNRAQKSTRKTLTSEQLPSSLRKFLAPSRCQSGALWGSS